MTLTNRHMYLLIKKQLVEKPQCVTPQNGKDKQLILSNASPSNFTTMYNHTTLESTKNHAFVHNFAWKSLTHVVKTPPLS